MWAYSPLLPATQQLSNTPPSVALNSPADTGTTSDTTPTFDFTGTDPNGDDVRYEVQVDTVDTFDSQSQDIGALSLNNNGAVYKHQSPSNDFSDISFFAWVKIDTNDQYNIIFMDGHGGGFGQGFEFGVKDNAHSNHLFIDIAYVAGVESALVINDNDWHFVGIQRRASDSKWVFWLDGSSDVPGNASDPYGNGGESMMVIGGENIDESVSPAFSGEIAKVGFWEQLLSSGDIASLYAGADVSSIPTSLVVDLPLDGGSWGTNGGSGGTFSENGTLAAGGGFTLPGGALLDKVSGTDAGFANPDNGGDTDPFNSGENVQYTVQAGDALAVGTYYWRVRAKDPSGSNAWGAWSSVRSFEVTSGGSGGTATPSVATVAMSLIAPSIAAGAALVATVLSAVFSLQAPTPRAGGTIAPAVHVATFSIPAPTSSGGASVAGSALGAVFGVQAPTVAGGSVASPSVLVATFSAQTATASGGGGAGGTAEPTVAVATFSIPSPVLSGGTNISPSALSLSFGIPALAVSGGANTAPSIANVTLSVPTPAESGGAVVSVAPVEVTIGIIDPALSGGAIITPAVGVATFTANEALASNLTPAEPSVAVVTFSALTPSAVIGGATVIPRECVIGPYDLIFLPSSGRLAKRITGNFYLEL